ncbi:MAG: radical SAM protein [Methanosarcinaceae archaeon]|nr:radical SAM protein [Methanosarcinaceae archaeon]
MQTAPSCKKVRASLGTLGVLGMELVMMDAPPTTAYLQIYTDKRCMANCRFCSQAAGGGGDLKKIARGMYIPSDLDEVVRRLGIAFERGYLKRACIQTVMYPQMWGDTTYLIKSIRERSQIPISLSVFPLDDEKYSTLKDLGVDKLVIPLDACNSKLFSYIKGKEANSIYEWETHLDGIRHASYIFGRQAVGTHLIIGMGESAEDALELIDRLHEEGVYSALFAYTQLPGTRNITSNLNIKHYRSVQFGTYLIRENLVSFADMVFMSGEVADFGVPGADIHRLLKSGEAFKTTGCPDCNRPYATETHKEIFNYPGEPTDKEIGMIREQLGITGEKR